MMMRLFLETQRKRGHRMTLKGTVGNGPKQQPSLPHSPRSCSATNFPSPICTCTWSWCHYSTANTPRLSSPDPALAQDRGVSGLILTLTYNFPLEAKLLIMPQREGVGMYHLKGLTDLRQREVGREGQGCRKECQRVTKTNVAALVNNSAAMLKCQG